MYDYSLHTHTCTQIHTEHKAIRTDSDPCQLCTHSPMPGMMYSGADGKESDAQAGASSISQFIPANVPLKDLALKLWTQQTSCFSRGTTLKHK